MAQPPQLHQKPTTEDAFVADRAVFWGRFTSFTKFATIAVAAIVLIVILIMKS